MQILITQKCREESKKFQTNKLLPATVYFDF